MKAKLITAATAAVLAAFAVEAAATPVTIDYTGRGCAMNVRMDAGDTYSQSFRPTFEWLRKAQFVLFRSDASTEKLTFVVTLRDQEGQVIATSNRGVLTARTNIDDAADGDSVMFNFRGRVKVTPGDLYRLQLDRADNDSGIEAYVCVLSDPLGEDDDGYSDGFMIWNENMQQGLDMEFAVKGADAAE